MLRSPSQKNLLDKRTIKEMKFDDPDSCFSQCGPGLSRLWPFQGDPCQVIQSGSGHKILVVDPTDETDPVPSSDEKDIIKHPNNIPNNILNVRETPDGELCKDSSSKSLPNKVC